MSPKKKKSTSPRNENLRIAKGLIARASRDYEAQLQEGDPGWTELAEMTRWMWIGAVVSKDAGEADHATAVQ